MSPEPTVLVMCGLPASGKTTTAGRLHAALGGTLIRSCDVFADLGISLPDWVRATKGFTERVTEYVALRDAAYDEMARRLEAALAAGAGTVVLDAVHGEPDKRARVYAVCRSRGARPLLVWCRCDDGTEIARRVEARRGHETEPESEAADLAVVRHLGGLWTDPVPDVPGEIGLVVYDTLASRVRERRGPSSPATDLVVAALAS